MRYPQYCRQLKHARISDHLSAGHRLLVSSGVALARDAAFCLGLGNSDVYFEVSDDAVALSNEYVNYNIGSYSSRKAPEAPGLGAESTCHPAGELRTIL